MMIVSLTQNKFAFVDRKDYASVSKIKWFARFDGYNWYAARNIKFSSGTRLIESMHSFILGKIAGFEIDHIDRNGLNNTRKNLRFLTHKQNMLNKRKQSNNTSGVVGVSFHKASRKYRAYGRLNGKHVHLGLHDTLNRAKRAYAKFATEHYNLSQI